MGENNVKATWRESTPDVVIEVVMHEARPKQCNHQCPWRVANLDLVTVFVYDHEVPNCPYDPGSYEMTSGRYEYLWDHLKTGRYGDQRGLCHIARRGTWEHARIDGFTGKARWKLVACQCTGALVLQQRELLRHVEHGRSALTQEGAARVAADMLGREVAESEVAGLDPRNLRAQTVGVRELLEHAHPALLDAEIGSPLLAPVSERELCVWGGGR
jgi:hypothetical protein